MHLHTEVLQHAHGHITDRTVERAGKIVGDFARALDHVFIQNVASSELGHKHRKRCDYKDDVRVFLKEYWSCNLFKYIPGREHSAFPAFSGELKFCKQDKLKQRIQRYTIKLDRRVCTHRKCMCTSPIKWFVYTFCAWLILISYLIHLNSRYESFRFLENVHITVKHHTYILVVLCMCIGKLCV